ncbi:MAG TPA: metal-sensitive transcriptional regulator [Symbiobacteriaceae bacterium]|jgi:DNA-binding FrmR family transcriptional regulator
MRTMPDVSRDEVIARVRRIAGQLRGIEKMLEDGRNCEEIVMQFTAVREAVNSAGAMVLEAELQHCLLDGDPAERPEAVTRTLHTLLKFAR